MGLSYIPKIVYNGITINFTYPPESDDGEQDAYDVTTSKAIAGDLQTVYNYNEITRSVKLSLLTPTQTANLQTFYRTWAALGNSFDYYESDNDAAKQTYTLATDGFNLNPVRQTYSGAQAGFLSSLEMKMRRAA